MRRRSLAEVARAVGGREQAPEPPGAKLVARAAGQQLAHRAQRRGHGLAGVLDRALDGTPGERIPLVLRHAQRLEVRDGARVRRFPVLQQPFRGHREAARRGAVAARGRPASRPDRVRVEVVAHGRIAFDHVSVRASPPSSRKARSSTASRFLGRTWNESRQP